ncbi:peptidase T2 asparaginase 2 [Gluconacetobacter diazotrophicus PA1 5]|uniref:isoaspartyl peptidase/L-asparaginase family protein n=1 Tax=Gluconacetobacter diazotrophicus TaxID=33996 RepID=UPI000173D619|nr:isoaspartyl peptidase/L-asparaginase [Gluconacetobacter diazotrophicus]ACI52961.1 peptidase T2 asparaginase 2 [Gluconacetobacter diazotrophicus PA1 5]TWB00099.1 beta-aspartyl-peptidase (threonine type) [Gluconacetobacter diazotrophicus]
MRGSRVLSGGIAAAMVMTAASVVMRPVTARADTVPVMVIHGGAGVIKADMSPERRKIVLAALAHALDAGYAALKAGKPAPDAVVAAIRVLEDDPNFNAGKGAVFTHDGHNEMDAAIMDGATLRAGAIAGVQHVRNPISLARAVMDHSPHVLLIGAGAEAFARTQGIALVDTSYFWTQRRWDQLQRALKEDAAHAQHADETTDRHFGTVGAVALDKAGHLAAGTSTGGMTDKLWGRVGDSPLIGAGTYANAGCAMSGTGWGEFYIRTVAAHEICMRVTAMHDSLAHAADDVINHEIPALGGNGGAILVDSAGDIAMPFNTDGMYRAWVGRDGVPHAAIFQ